MLRLAPLESGRWYIVVTCRGCDARLPLFEDLKEGQGKQLWLGLYFLTCPYCRLEETYSAEHYFHEPKAN